MLNLKRLIPAFVAAMALTAVAAPACAQLTTEPANGMSARGTVQSTDIVPCQPGGAGNLEGCTASAIETYVASVLALTSSQVTTGLGFTPVSVSGTITTGDCPQFSSATVISDSGVACTGGSSGVTSLDSRTGAVTLSASDINAALSSPLGWAYGGTDSTSAAGVAAEVAPYIINSIQVICTGSNDSAAINTALAAQAAAGGAAVTLTPNSTDGCGINATLDVPANVAIQGAYGYNGLALVETTPDLSPMVSLEGDGSSIQNIFINGGSASYNTSGTIIASASAGLVKQVVSNVNIVGAFGGIDLSGTFPTILNSNIYYNGMAGSFGIRLGALSTGANTIQPQVFNTNASSYGTGTNSGWGMIIKDCGGCFLNNAASAFGGTLIEPGLNQAIDWLTANDSYLGDTSNTASLDIDTADSTAEIKGITLNNDWASTSSSTVNVTIANTAGGTVDGVHFNELRSYGGAGNGLVINSGVTDVTVNGSHICGVGGGGSSYSDVLIAASVGVVSLTANQLGAGCDGLPTTGHVTNAIGLQAGAIGGLTVVGNDLTGPTDPIGGDTPTGNVVIANNRGLDDVTTTVASASSITIGNSPTIAVTGTTSVSTITTSDGYEWNNRQITLITTGGAISFATGGNLCNAVTSTENVPMTATWLAGSSCWAISGGGSGGGGASGVSSFNTRTGSVTLTSGDVTGALTFTPADSGANSDITKLTGLTTALGSPYGGTGNSSPTGYLYGNGSSAATASTTIPGSAVSGDITGNAANISGTYAGTVSSSQITTGLGYTPFAPSGTITTGDCAKFASATTISDSGVVCGGGGGGVPPAFVTAAATVDQSMTSSNTFYNGPSVNIGSGLTGQTWFATANITVTSSSALTINCVLATGSDTIIASGQGDAKANTISLSGITTSPGTQIYTQCESSGTTSVLAHNATGQGMDTTTTAWRIN